MSHTLGAQQNYSSYFLFFAGIVLILVDYKCNGEEKKSPYQLAMEKSAQNKKMPSIIGIESSRGVMEITPRMETEKFDSNDQNESSGCQGRDTEVEVSQKVENVLSTNPYDIPDDF